MYYPMKTSQHDKSSMHVCILQDKNVKNTQDILPFYRDEHIYQKYFGHFIRIIDHFYDIQGSFWQHADVILTMLKYLQASFIYNFNVTLVSFKHHSTNASFRKQFEALRLGMRINR